MCLSSRIEMYAYDTDAISLYVTQKDTVGSGYGKMSRFFFSDL